MKQTCKRRLAGLVCTVLCATGAASLPNVQAAQAAASPLINREVPVYSNAQATAYASCNAQYNDAWYGSAPGYLAYDLSNVPAAQRQMVNVAWYAAVWNNYDYTVRSESGQAAPKDYTISVNAAAGGSYPEEGWVDVVTVTDNVYHSRQHLIDMTGYQWVRMTVTAAQSGATVTLNIDIHDCSAGTVDSWIFFGDSITAGGMTTFSSGDGNFADLLHALDARFYPAQENGGIGAIFSTDGKNNIDRWLADFPGRYVSIAYGTNDCWGDQTGAVTYYDHLVYMVRAIQASGKIAVVPKIPFSLEAGISAHLADYNAKIDQLYKEYPTVVKGPDFDAFFQTHPEYLGADGVHPNTEGYNAMRHLWAETVYEAIYRNASAVEPLAGDVNEDGAVTIADAVCMVHYLTQATNGSYPAWAVTMDLDHSGVVDAVDGSLLKAMLLSQASV